MVKTKEKDTSLDEMFARMESVRRQKVDEDYERVLDSLSDDELFEVAYVPFVVSEIVWDYVDTIINYAIMLGQTETKGLTREIRELRRDYDRCRFGVISDESRKNETENMISFQEELGSFFTEMFDEYKDLITATYGEMEENRLWLVSSVFVCLTVLDALTGYEGLQRKRLSSILGYCCNHIIPREMRALSLMVPKYALNMRYPAGMGPSRKKYRARLLNYICQVKINTAK